MNASLSNVLAMTMIPRSVSESLPNKRPAKPQSTRRKTPIATGILLLVLLLAFALGLPAAYRRGIDLFNERDREAFQAQVELWEEADEWDQASELTRVRLARPISVRWKRELQGRLHDYQLLAASKATSEFAVPYLERAREIAAEAHLKGDLTIPLEQGIVDAEALRKAKLQLLERDDQISKLQDDYREHQSHLSLAAAEHISDLRLWGDTLRDESERAREKYDRALALSRTFNFPADEIRKRTSTLATPIDLPTHSELHVIGASQSALKVELNLLVTQPDGQGMAGLSRKDFRVFSGDQPWDRWTVAPSSFAEPHFIAVCFDTSGSMQGEAIRAAIAAVRTLPDRFPNSDFELISFSDSTQIVLPWTRDQRAFENALMRLNASGATALYKGGELAAHEVAPKQGRRSIVLCADGRDSVGGTTLSRTIERCRQAEAAVYVVSLETRDSDPATLQALASATGGFVVTAKDPGQLSTAFRTIARGLERPGYLLTVLDAPEGTPLRIRLGAKQPLEATWSKSAARSANGQ